MENLSTALERHGVPGAIACEAERERGVALRYEHGVVYMKPGVGPVEHAGTEETCPVLCVA
jgi:hypothetical protein